GLVDVLTDQENLRTEATRLALEIAENAPLAVTSVRATMRNGLADAVIQATEHELSEQKWLRGTEDSAEGIRAVSERRPGNFTGK
ncbi:MAG: enoyl-CoA hydratase-related protein, partial [Gammaproteobacteria bacterium]|nr:enoyl-CoA hydratase-related protein [Gammaproteobacteria bacterium]